jgi:hypothetical protein
MANPSKTGLFLICRDGLQTIDHRVVGPMGTMKNADFQEFLERVNAMYTNPKWGAIPDQLRTK